MTQLTQTSRLKAEARRLRTALADQNISIAHPNTLELLAKSKGVRDWNTLSAQQNRTSTPDYPSPGTQVRISYVGQPATARVIGVHLMSRDEAARLTLDLDAPLDVYPHSAVHISRRRLTAVIRPDGTSLRRSADGVPHLTMSAVAEP